MTGDESPIAAYDGRKSSIAAVGPQLGYALTVNDQPAYANLRGYWEFGAKNRVEGTAVFVTLSIPLGHKSSKKAAQ